MCTRVCILLHHGLFGKRNTIKSSVEQACLHCLHFISSSSLNITVLCMTISNQSPSKRLLILLTRGVSIFTHCNTIFQRCGISLCHTMEFECFTVLCSQLFAAIWLK